MLGGACEVDSIDFSAYTAGTGNAGTTILSATVSNQPLGDRARSNDTNPRFATFAA